MMKYLSIAFRICLGVAVLYCGALIAGVMGEDPVTHRDAVLIATLLCFGSIALGIARVFLRPGATVVHASTVPFGAAVLAPQNRKGLDAARRAALERRARHEAAHAVAAHALGHRVLSASIRPLGDSDGRVLWQQKDQNGVSVDRVAVAYAGPLAEQPDNAVQPAATAADDYTVVLRSAIAASIADPERRSPTQILHDSTCTARRIVEEHAVEIDLIAEALLEAGERRDLEEEELLPLLAGIVPATGERPASAPR